MKKRDAPVCFRASREERARLERDAAGMSLGAYIKWRLFDPVSPPPRTRSRTPVRDQMLLASLLGLIGRSRIPQNLNQIARAVNNGTLVVTPQTEALIRMACRAIHDTSAHIRKALGLSVSEEP